MVNGATFCLVSTIFQLILAFTFFSKKHIKTTELRIYSFLLVINLTGLIIELCLNTLILYTPSLELLIIFLSKIFLLYYIVFTIAFFMYTLLISLGNDKYQSIKNITLKVLTIVGFIVAIAILFANIYINYETPYSYGPANEILYGFVSIMIAASIGTAIYNFKRLKTNRYWPLIIYIFGTVAVAVIQKINPALTLSTSFEAILLCIMYFTIENPDVQMIEELKVAKDAAEKANHAKSEFLSSMSHEIRTPLNAIVGFSESLKEDRLDAPVLEKVDSIIMASNNLLEIVNGILDISKIEANKLEIINKDYDIRKVFDDLVSLIKTRIGDSGLEFNVSIPEDLPSVLYGDRARLKQIILNLLTNAVKYTKEGYINFTVSSVIKDNICRLIISVEDSGIGIKEESIPKLFTKFERLDVEKQMTIEGTGLGLAITKKLIDLMHGTIIVQSIYGQGSKFTISVDQRIISVKELPEPKTPVIKTQHIDAFGARALIVDDNELNIKVATVLMKKYHFDIDSCTSGQECINKIKNDEKYDIIFLDDMMPRMNGREVLKVLKNISNFNTPVIVLTANAITGMKEEYLEYGFDDYLSKPIEKDELERVVKKYLCQINNEKASTEISPKATSVIVPDYLDITERVDQLLAESDVPVRQISDTFIEEIQKEIAAEELEETKKKKKKKRKKQKESSIEAASLPNSISPLPEQESIQVSTKEETIPTPQKQQVLIVNDNPIEVKIALTNLKNYPAEIKTVSSGPECIEEVIMKKYSLILMDEEMPDMDGCTTLENLNTIEDFNIPVVLMSSKPSQQASNIVSEHHFNGYITKPFTKESLERTLNEFLN